MKRRLVFWLILLVAGFLAGFIPQYSTTRQLQQSAAALSNEVAACHSAQALSQARSAATLMYLEATQKNYGNAGNYASQFYDQVQGLANSSQSEPLRNALREILNSRDQVTADLAKGDAAAVSEMQPVIAKLESIKQ